MSGTSAAICVRSGARLTRPSSSPRTRPGSSAASRSREHPASHHVADLGLMVAAGHRRRGIGRSLLEQAVEWARENEIEKLELHVFPHNQPAIKLYEQFGFDREGLRRGHFRRGGGLVDAVLMAYRVN